MKLIRNNVFGEPQVISILVLVNVYLPWRCIVFCRDMLLLDHFLDASKHISNFPEVCFTLWVGLSLCIVCHSEYLFMMFEA